MGMLKTIALPEYGVDLYESKHEEGDVVTEHYHTSYQILYALDGDGIVTAERQTYRFQPDHAIILPPKAIHSVKSNSNLTLLVLAFDASIFESDSLGSELKAYFLTPSYIKLDLFAANELRRMLRQILFEQVMKDAMYRLAIKLTLFDILLVAARVIKQGNSIESDSNSLRADKIREYIDTHYFEKLTADTIGDRMGISARYVNTIFKNQYKITPTQYLTNVRIELVKKMLAETDKSIVSIAFEAGYETLPTFYRSFKNKTKLSPQQYRQLRQMAEK